MLGLELPINHSHVMKNYLSMRAAQSKKCTDHTCLFGETEICGYFIQAAPHGLVPRFPFDVLCYLISYSLKKKKKSQQNLVYCFK